MDKIAHDEVSIRRVVSRLGEPARVRACYEAGPTGYELIRQPGAIADRLFEVEFLDAGVEAYRFTFG